MLAEAGAPLGMKFRFLDPATDISAQGLGEHVCAPYEDIDALEEFVRGLDAITYEFENVRLESARWLAQRVFMGPNAESLRTAGDRLFEKNFFAECGVPLPPYSTFFFRDEFEESLRTIGLPCVIKTRRFGYDGKGQRVLRTEEDAERAWKELNGMPLFLEGFVPFERELSLICVRSREEECRFYPLVQNHHRDGILRLSEAPAAGVSPALQKQAEKHARKLLERLDYVGVLAIEFFELEGRLLANEMAPRVHNSGHWSIEGAETSQFENHLRAVTGMPLGSVEVKGFSAMINLIGEIPAAARSLDLTNCFLHDYGKRPRAGRKVGHITVCANSRAALASLATQVAERIGMPLTAKIATE